MDEKPKNKGGRPKKKHPGGRPPIINEITIQKLEHAFSIGCTDLEACLHAGISKSTLYNYQNANPKFLDRKEILKERPVLKARLTVTGDLDQVDTAKWYLERKTKDNEFSQKSETKMSGDLTINVTYEGD